MKKLSEEHYIIVDDSEIKDGDWIGFPNLKKFVPVQYFGGDLTGGEKKITRSTQPLEYSSKIGKYWGRVQPIELSEVKELLGVVDVEKSMWYERNLQNPYPLDSPSNTGFKKGFELGYNQALEDNNHKKWTDADVIRIVEKSRQTGLTAEYLMLSLQPQTEWEVEIVDGKLKLI